MMSVYIVAVERSGDEIGAALVNELRALDPTLAFNGTGGSEMAKLGLSSCIDVSDLAILGFVEAIKVYAIALDRVRQVTEDILKHNPDGVILIDSWGFMIRVAKSLKSKGYKGKIIKYVAPQVWAMRAGRAKILAKYVDHLLTIHSFDKPYFEPYGLPVSYTGNPIFDTDFGQGDGQALRDKLNLSKDQSVICILFGSRLSEVQNLAKPFADTVDILSKKHPNAVFISPVSESVATDVAAAAGADLRLQNIIFLPENQKFDVFAAADMALACSGTVTTQLACIGVPTVVAYKLNGLTYLFAKHLYKPKYISIVNIAADKPLMPEFVQKDCNGENLASALSHYIKDKTSRTQVRKALKQQTLAMKGEGGQVSARVAKAVHEIITEV